ncbi:CYFA0S04e05358g1_1 [Cyberlindnera fabianii]|uniref:CYFA0S04e05358g1_1 n=1 Tax=Cyberlindnera fabianii TaxID=36022 RepID=A0A061AXQ2_CYBFA|nr:CYFA0S04e05358g1_1 [Cyberlindnera fabianii]
MAKRIVVIGGGFFGIWCANKLLATKKDYDITLISKSKFAYFLISSVRVSVENDTDRSLYPLTELVKEGIRIVHDEVMLMKEDSVELKQMGTLEFDALIIATGAKWAAPIGYTHQFGDDYQNYFANEHKKIEEAKHIVLIGGGYNNAELAGELHDRYKEELKKGSKKVTMIHSRQLMLPEDGFYAEKLRKRVTEFYQNETDVRLILGTRALISDEDPNTIVAGTTTIKADLVYHSIGVEASIPPHNFDNFTDAKGFIRVEDTFQCTAIPKGNVFAIGDVANFNYKGLVARRGWYAAVVHNVQRVLSDPDCPLDKLKKCDRKPYHITSIVSLGAYAGCGQLFTIPYFNYTVMLPEWFCRLQKSKDMGRRFAKWLFANG